ncbi:hypothetical protein RY607_001030 [Raoultella planticola]|nr:hypothetical protein [Raoultella planticola]
MSEGGMTSNCRFKQKLIEQISFLESSCERYDQGHTVEALRIALSLRVIFYTTGKSKSILKHMGIEGIHLLSTGGIPKEQCENLVMFQGLGMKCFSNGKIEYIPSLGDGPPMQNKFLPLREWWNECVYVVERGNLITRLIIMIAAANNDGGAHVDEELEPLYASLAADSSLGTVEIINEHYEVISNYPIINAHHTALRQMAYEVLHSPEFISLVD